MNSRRFAITLGLTSILLPVETARSADFAYGFEGMPERLAGTPGEVKTFDVYLTLTATSNESPDGAQGWAVFLKAVGGSITNFTIRGVEVSTIYDEDSDFDPATPPIHHDPYLFDLGHMLDNIFGSLTHHGGDCAVEVIAGMKFQEKMVLQPAGAQRIGKLTVQGMIPAGGRCGLLEIRYEDPPVPSQCGDLHMDQPAKNMVTWNGRNIRPTLGSISVLLCPSVFRRGDSNSDNLVDISDAIHLLAFLFLGGAPPDCRDAADMNDDGALDLSDAVFLLRDLFLPVQGAGLPDPGPHACGPDPTGDGLGCERSPCL